MKKELTESEMYEIAYITRNERVAQQIGPYVAEVLRGRRLIQDGPAYTPTERRRQWAAVRALVQELDKTDDFDRFCQQYDDGRTLARSERKNLELQTRMRTDADGSTAISEDLPGAAFYWGNTPETDHPTTITLSKWTGGDGAPVSERVRLVVTKHLEQIADAIRADEEEGE